MKKALYILIIIFLSVSITGCGRIVYDIFGNTNQENGTSAIRTAENEEQPGSALEEEVSDEGKKDHDDDIGQDPAASEPDPVPGPYDHVFPPLAEVYLSVQTIDIEMARDYFKKGVGLFEEGEYLLAQYYFDQIKDGYTVLQDHIYYYLAKSLLLQEKHVLSGEAYTFILDNHSDSIFYEKALLEHADLAFILEDYGLAEQRYADYIASFEGSELIPYAINQLAVCRERNGKVLEAIGSYKRIYLDFPLSEYSDQAYTNIRYLEEQNSLEPFIPSNQDIIDRAEIFFGAYVYESAIGQYDLLLDGAERQSSLTTEQNAKVVFKLGMCYYNLRDYQNCMQYLSEGYERFPGSSYSDDFLYFLGRAYTNLDNDPEAIRHYDILLSDHPNSNFSDDALYRKGRIYFFQEDYANALANYQRIIDEYPAGDRLQEAYWESGWLQYSSQDYGAARNTFSSMSASFKGTSLEEKALFWEAKSLQKIGEVETAVQIYKSIISKEGYSYYTFASSRILDGLAIDHSIETIDTRAYPDNTEIADILPKVFEGLERSETGTYGVITHIDKAKELLGFEFYDSASSELEKGSDELEESPINILQVSTLYLKARDYINSQRIISKYYSRLDESLESPYSDYFYYLLYPYGYKEYVDYYSLQHGVDPLFTLAVIREESRFQPDAGSFAGALGLMQIIPSTGQAIASQLGISGFDTGMLLDPETSIKMGTYYLREQLDNFNENKYFTCGAYNGGPGAMSRWIDQNWNGDIDEFIENISYDETRNYVKKVMGSYFVYSMIY